MVAASAETLAIIAYAKDVGVAMGGEVFTDSSAALGISQRLGLCKLRHPNVLSFYGAVVRPPLLCIVAELMHCDLRHFLRVNASSAMMHRFVASA